MSAVFCCDPNRRDAVKDHGGINGIDWVEVLDREAPPGSPRQQTLLLRCLLPVAALGIGNIRIEGGERVTNLRVLWVAPADNVPVGPLTIAAERTLFGALPEPDHVLVIRVDKLPDASPYVLRIVRGPDNKLPPKEFDPLLSDAEIAFKVDCESSFDCRVVESCPPTQPASPAIDYLAKDYASFRRLMLDRMRQLVPGYQEKSPADLAMSLVEILAYTGDLLSYRQDAIATEAYLGTARNRVSLARHAALVDYRVDNGCNARTWIQLQVASDGASIAPTQVVQFLTGVEGVPPGRIAPASDASRKVLEAHPEIFEPLFAEGMAAIPLYAAHNKIGIHDWGQGGCCLPLGTTRATLRGHLTDLKAGDVLLFEEVKGARTGLEEDADVTKRHVVRLVDVEHTRDGTALQDALTAEDITNVVWQEEDALPFPLCLSARLDSRTWVRDVSVARGNLVLADHGESIAEEPLGRVPEPSVILPAVGDSPCDPLIPQSIPARYTPVLARQPLTRRGRRDRPMLQGGRMRIVQDVFDPLASASSALRWEPGSALAKISVRELEPNGDGHAWDAQPDLLDSLGAHRHFVIENDNEQRSRLRFGDGTHGRRAASGSQFWASYRVGNGTRGNVGADAVAYILGNDGRITGARNPIPARGGREPESAAQIRRRAPQAFRRQERAVTPDDYAALASRSTGVQRAAVTARWTGSWHSMFITVDREQGARVDESFRQGLRDSLEKYRLAGHDLRVDAPRFVPLRLELHVCVRPDYFRSDVERALLVLFSSGPDGFFHPDRFTFGQPVYLSAILAAAHSVPGVLAASADVFRREDRLSPAVSADGVIQMGRLEIAQLDSDPNYPDRGVLIIRTGGGK